MSHNVEQAMAAVLSWFIALPKTVQAFGAALTLMGAGSFVTLTMLGVGGLPETVAEHTLAIERLQDQQNEDSRVMRRALCILELQVESGHEALTPIAVQRRCP